LIQGRVQHGDPDRTYTRARDHAGVIELPEDTLFRDRQRTAPTADQVAWKELVEELSIVLQKDRTSAPLWRARGLAHAALGRWKEAAQDFSEALKRRPKDREARRGRGRAHVELARWEEAVADLTYGRPPSAPSQVRRAPAGKGAETEQLVWVPGVALV